MQLSGSFENKYLSGKCLYGDDLDSTSIQQWFTAEESGYYQLAAHQTNYVYSYHALNELLAYRHLNRGYRVCVALGCAAGDDVSPLASRVGEFIAIEPAERWWRNSIAGKAARYLKPSFTGDVPLGDSVADLFVALGVLHHIPNVSHVLDEISRVLAENGHFVLREPISSMGDWRKPRRGLTANERGLPVNWLDEALGMRGFEVVKRTFCCFPPLARLMERLDSRAPYNRTWIVLIDLVLCHMTKSNLHYHRSHLWEKIAPAAIYYVLRKKSKS